MDVSTSSPPAGADQNDPNIVAPRRSGNRRHTSSRPSASLRPTRNASTNPGLLRSSTTDSSGMSLAPGSSHSAATARSRPYAASSNVGAKPSSGGSAAAAVTLVAVAMRADASDAPTLG